MNRRRAAPITPTKRSSALIRLSWATPAMNIIAEIAAVLTPTVRGVYSRAAISQYTSPRTAMTPSLATSA